MKRMDMYRDFLMINMKILAKIMIIMVLTISVILTGCSSNTVNSTSPEHKDMADTPKSTDDKTIDTDQDGSGISAPEPDSDPEHDDSQNISVINETNKGDAPNEVKDDAPDETKDESANSDPKPWDIVWLGDSLTQGSLGPDNGNENNPQAPWRVLADLSGKNVDGWGLYGYNTHDILWVYSENGGIKDPAVTYVYWVGSNDFHDSPDNITNVMDEIDRFNTDGGITRYLVLGTTNRGDLEEGFEIPVNNAFAGRYGERYLDIMPYVEYGPDKIHLTEGSYRRIAEAVYDKLMSLGYL